MLYVPNVLKVLLLSLKDVNLIFHAIQIAISAFQEHIKFSIHAITANSTVQLAKMGHTVIHVFKDISKLREIA